MTELRRIEPARKLDEGDLLPRVCLPSSRSRTVDLVAEAQTEHLVLFFYPGDREGLRYSELAGCTPEACAFRDSVAELRALGAEVFGVSLQRPERQREFVDREHLSFELLSDEGRALTDALGVARWRSGAGEEFVVRTTFIIERGGSIAKVYRDVEVDGHVERVSRELRRLVAARRDQTYARAT